MKTTKKVSTNKYLQSLSLGLLGTATAFSITAIPQEAQAQALSYSYSYQEIRNLKLSGLDDLLVNPGSFLFQPTSTTQAGLNGATAGNISGTDPLEAVVGGAGLGENAGFFDNDALNSAWRGSGNPADFSRSDAQLAFVNSAGQIQTIATPEQLTELLLNSESEIRLANVAESLVQLPGSVPAGPPNTFTDQGNARGSYSFGVSDFEVTQTTVLGIDFDYLNALAIELSGPSPVPGETSFTQAQFQFAVSLVATDDQGNTTDLINYIVAPNTASLSANNTVQESTSVVRNDIGLTPDFTPPDFVFTTDSPSLTATLTPGSRYSLNFNAFEQVDTRIFEDRGPGPVDAPEPASLVGLLGVGALGLGLKRKKQA